MGASPQLELNRRPRRRAAFRSRRGIALPAVLFALVALGLLVAGLFTIADVQARGTNDWVDAARAVHVAEAGLAHALGVLRNDLSGVSMTQLIRGPDGTWGTADDGILADWPGLSSDDEIPAAGREIAGGRYFVTVRDDPADPNGDPSTDSNNRVLVECRGETAFGSTAIVNAVLANAEMPGLMVDGPVEISGKLSLEGACGGAHANGSFSGGGEPSAQTEWSSTGSIPSKYKGTKQPNSPPMEVPDLNPLDFCPAGATNIQNNLWKPHVNSLDGVYCVTGNFEPQGDVGSMNNMRSVTVLVSGSIKISGKPHWEAAHPDGWVLMAGGDLDIQGDSGFRGSMYCGGQIYFSSKPQVIGGLVCKNKSPHPGQNWVSKNLISGDARITFDCDGPLSQSWQIVSWHPTIGS